MNPIIHVHKRVDVVTIFNNPHSKKPIAYPFKMKYNGKEITFCELGLRHPTAKGKRMIHVFDVSDGQADYRLEFDAEALTWTVTAILERT